MSAAATVGRHHQFTGHILSQVPKSLRTSPAPHLPRANWHVSLQRPGQLACPVSLSAEGFARFVPEPETPLGDGAVARKQH